MDGFSRSTVELLPQCEEDRIRTCSLALEMRVHPQSKSTSSWLVCIWNSSRLNEFACYPDAMGERVRFELTSSNVVAIQLIRCSDRILSLNARFRLIDLDLPLPLGYSSILINLNASTVYLSDRR